MQHLMCLLSAQSSWTSHTRAGAIGLQTGFKNSWSDCLTSKHSPGRSQLLLCMQGVCSRRLVCRCQMTGPKTPLRPPGQDPADPSEDHPMSWLAAPNFSLSEADRAECQARCAL